MNNTLVKLLTISAVSLGMINVNCVEANQACKSPVQGAFSIGGAFGKIKIKRERDPEAIDALKKKAAEKDGDQYSTKNLTQGEVLTKISPVLSLQQGANAVPSSSNTIVKGDSGEGDEVAVATLSSKVVGNSVVSDVSYNFVTDNDNNVAKYSLKKPEGQQGATENATTTIPLEFSVQNKDAVLYNTIVEKNDANSWTTVEEQANFKTQSAGAVVGSLFISGGVMINTQSGISINIEGLYGLPVFNKEMTTTGDSTTDSRQQSNTTDSNNKTVTFKYTKKWEAGILFGLIGELTEKFSVGVDILWLWEKWSVNEASNTSNNNTDSSSTNNNNNDLKINNKFDLKFNGPAFGLHFTYMFNQNFGVDLGVRYHTGGVMKNSTSSTDSSTVNACVRNVKEGSVVFSLTGRILFG